MTIKHNFLYMKLAFSLLLGWLVIPASTFAQSPDYAAIQAQVKQSYLTGTPDYAEESLAQLLAHPQPGEDQWMEIILSTYYQMIGGCGSRKGCTEGGDWVRSALEISETWLERSPEHGKALAFHAAFLGMKIEYAPARAFYLAPLSQKYLSKAEEAAPLDPQVWIEKGNFAYHAPALFGGDMELAEAHFGRAVEILAAQSQTPADSWLYLHALVYQARAAHNNGKKEKALALYQQVLKLEPTFSWVKDQLIPQLSK